MAKRKEPKAEWHWRCQKCQRPIEDSGVIEVVNINADLGPIGSYPKAATPDENVSSSMPIPVTGGW